MINIGKDIRHTCFPMDKDQILLYPTYKVVFESSLDDLVKKVRSEKLVDISMRKICSERLLGPRPNTCFTRGGKGLSRGTHGT